MILYVSIAITSEVDLKAIISLSVNLVRLSAWGGLWPRHQSENSCFDSWPGTFHSGGYMKAQMPKQGLDKLIETATPDQLILVSTATFKGQ